MATYSYLDLSTGHLRQDELSLAECGCVFTRVIRHEYGAWVAVPEGSDDCEDGERRKEAPSLQACIERAREYGCRWINFDRDGDREPRLPYFEW